MLYDAVNLFFAATAGRAFPPIDLEESGEAALLAAGVLEIGKRRTAEIDRTLEDTLGGAPKTPHLIEGQTGDGSARIESCGKKDLRSVNIAQTDESVLPEQPRFEILAAAPEQLAKSTDVQFFRERIDTGRRKLLR